MNHRTVTTAELLSLSIRAKLEKKGYHASVAIVMTSFDEALQQAQMID